MFKFLVLSSSLTIYMLMSPHFVSLVQKSHLKLRTSPSQLPSQYLLQDQETGVSRMTRQQCFLEQSSIHVSNKKSRRLIIQSVGWFINLSTRQKKNLCNHIVMFESFILKYNLQQSTETRWNEAESTREPLKSHLITKEGASAYHLKGPARGLRVQNRI